jgi:hypothetical protein
VKETSTVKKALVVAIAASLVAALGASPATAKKKVKPTPHVLYFHGSVPSGEAYYADSVANSTGFQKMDPAEPADPAPKSMGVTNYVAGPNTTCSGNALFPTWEGAVTGKVSGDLKVYLNAVSHAASNVKVDVFADGLGGCESTLGSTGYTPPVATTTVTLTPGPAETEVVFEKVNFKSTMNMVVMVTPIDMAVAGESVLDPQSQARLLYDSPDFASRIEFLCAPASGKSCTP